MKPTLLLTSCLALLLGGGCASPKGKATHPSAVQASQKAPKLRKHDENYWPEVRKANESYRPPEYTFAP